MDIPNYVKNELFKNKNYIAEMTKASEQLFDSIKDTFFTGKDREVKVLRTDKCIYVLDKHRKDISIGWSKIEDFLANQTTEELLRYTTWRLEEYEKNPKEDDKGEFYLLNIHSSKRSEFLEQIQNGSFQDDGIDILPALKNGDSCCQTCMSARENVFC